MKFVPTHTNSFNICYFFSDGQSVAARIGKQLQKNNQELAKSQRLLTDLQLTKDLADPDHDMYRDLVPGMSLSQQRAALAHAEYDRACEAETMVLTDMVILVNYLAAARDRLMAAITSPASTAEKGEQHLLCLRLVLIESELDQHRRLFGTHIPEQDRGEVSWVWRLVQDDCGNNDFSQVDLVPVDCDEECDEEDFD